MKNKFIAAVLLLIATYSCNNFEKKENSDCSSYENELENTKESFNKTYPDSDVLLDQETILILGYNGDLEIKNRYQASGFVNTAIDQIKIIVPISDSDIKIKKYHNISSNNFNVLLLILDKEDNKGDYTECIPTHLIKTQFKLSELKFDKYLDKLFVISLYTNNFNVNNALRYQKVIYQASSYEDIGSSINLPCNNNSFKPDEEGGDIIP